MTMIYCIRCYAEKHHNVGRRAREAAFIINGESVCMEHAKVSDTLTLEVDPKTNGS